MITHIHADPAARWLAQARIIARQVIAGERDPGPATVAAVNLLARAGETTLADALLNAVPPCSACLPNDHRAASQARGNCRAGPRRSPARPLSPMEVDMKDNGATRPPFVPATTYAVLNRIVCEGRAEWIWCETGAADRDHAEEAWTEAVIGRGEPAIIYRITTGPQPQIEDITEEVAAKAMQCLDDAGQIDPAPAWISEHCPNLAREWYDRALDAMDPIDRAATLMGI